MDVAHHSEITNCRDEISVNLSDKKAQKSLDEFVLSGCGCKKGPNNTHCSSQFSKDYISSVRDSCFELTHQELDMLLIGQIVACTGTNKISCFRHQDKPICKNMFFFFHSISQKRLANIKQSMTRNGLVSRNHGNSKHTPHNALPFEVVQNVVKFIHTFAEENALVLPGRVPGYSRSDIQLLPSSLSKRKIWNQYSSSTEKCVAYFTFCKLWKSLIPSILIMKPMTDLCWQCQQNSTAVIRSANCSEEEKSVTIQKAEEHLRIVHIERSFYNFILKECAESVKGYYQCEGKFSPPPPSSRIKPNSVAIKAHYAFDFAQQVHFPCDPMQPGPINFVTTRKCSVFGICCETIPRQINFLTDESGEIGKGANTVISKLHFFFKGTVSLYSPGALLKIEIRHFDGPVFPYTLRAPRQYTIFYLARNSRAGEVESLPWRTLCSLLISTHDRSNLQTFRHWKPYLYPVFYRSIPESRAPKLKQKKR